MEKDDLKKWLLERRESSKNDMSGTNEYHDGVENTLDAVLEYLDSQE